MRFLVSVFPALAFSSLLFGSLSAVAAPPRLEFPARCNLGQDCLVFQYFDEDPGPDARDYACGIRSYDRHRGTDIALKDIATIERGIPVLAAAAGTVRNIRDGMNDAVYGEDNRESVEDRECGNGVAIAHGDGWETQYCHMRKGSVRVRPGEQVTAGQALGDIGMSGAAAFPHLHISVRHNGQDVDPFVGEGAGKNCGVGAGVLWTERALAAMPYSPVDVLASGIDGRGPKRGNAAYAEEAYAGRLSHRTVASNAPVLIGWAVVVGARQGDRISLRIVGPDGETLVEHGSVLSRNRAREFQFVGKRRHSDPWPAGEYRVSVEVQRDTDGKPFVRRAQSSVSVR